MTTDSDPPSSGPTRTRSATTKAKTQKPRSVTFDLEFPILVDGHETSQVTMRRPVGRDILAADKMKGSMADKGLRMVMNLSELPEEALLDMDASDYMRLVGFVGECMGVSQDVAEA